MNEEVQQDYEIKFESGSGLKRDKGSLLNKNDSNFTIDSQQLIHRDDSINIKNNSEMFGNNDENDGFDNKNEFEVQNSSKNDDNMQF